MTNTTIQIIDGIKHYFTQIGQQTTITAYHQDKNEIDLIASRLEKTADTVEVSSIRGEWKVKAVITE